MANVFAKNPGRYSHRVIMLNDKIPKSSATSLTVCMTWRLIEGL